MRFRKLGRSGLSVSEFSLGSWRTYGDKCDFAQSERCIRAAFDRGVNHFDAADTYGNGNAERFLGRALAPLPRHQYVISSKCYFPTADHPNARGLSRKHVTEALNQSLKNSGLDYLDLYYCHRFDDTTPLDETIRALQDLIRQGKLLYWGVSRWTPDQMSAAVDLCAQLGAPCPISHQHWYNVINPQPEETMFPECRRLGLGVIAYSPLAQGILTGKYCGGAIPADSRATRAVDSAQMWDLEDRTRTFVGTLEAEVRSHGFSLSSFSLAWCLRRGEVASVLIGASNPAQVEANLDALDVVLPEELVERVNAQVRQFRRGELSDD